MELNVHRTILFHSKEKNNTRNITYNSTKIKVATRISFRRIEETTKKQNNIRYTTLQSMVTSHSFNVRCSSSRFYTSSFLSSVFNMEYNVNNVSRFDTMDIIKRIKTDIRGYDV